MLSPTIQLRNLQNHTQLLTADLSSIPHHRTCWDAQSTILLDSSQQPVYADSWNIAYLRRIRGAGSSPSFCELGMQ